MNILKQESSMFGFLMTTLMIPPPTHFAEPMGGVGAEFYNSYSQAVVRDSNNQTTLTIVNDVEGNLTVLPSLFQSLSHS